MISFRFYITAESKGSCRALWCSLTGAGDRRASFLRASSPMLTVMPAGSPSTKPATPLGAPGQSGGRVKKITGLAESPGSGVQNPDEKGSGGSAIESRHERRVRAQAEAERVAAAASAAAAAMAAKRAATLSAALIASDNEVASAARASRRPLFHSHHDSTGSSSRAGGWGAAPGEKNDNASGDWGGGLDDDEPVNIAVVSRCRPLLTREMKRGVRPAVFCDGNEIVVSGESLPNKRARRFGFDRVFGKSAGAKYPSRGRLSVDGRTRFQYCRGYVCEKATTKLR